LDECEYRCYLDANCVSLNIKNKDPNGTHECELNNSTHLEHDGNLTDNQLYYYRGAENHCGKPQKKCQNNATCLSGFTSKKYRCVCSPGFEGENCEDDDVCHWQKYQNLSDAERKHDYVRTKYGKCDNKLNGWYRFQGAAGTKMVTTCPLEFHCDTAYPIWLSGGHSTVAEGTVPRKVCIHKSGKCCFNWFFIQVKNCSSYYIYKLDGLRDCDARYCSTD